MRMLIVHNWYYHCLLLLVFPFFFLNLSFSLQFINECILSNSISKEPCCLPKPTNMSKSRHSQLNEGAHRSILQRLRTEKDPSFFIYQDTALQSRESFEIFHSKLNVCFITKLYVLLFKLLSTSLCLISLLSLQF